MRPVVLVDGLPDVGVLRDRGAHRHAAHQLDTTRDRSVDDARRDHRVREVGGLLRRTTLRVDRRRRDFHRQARGEPRVAGHVHRLHPDLAHAPAHDLADLARIHTRARAPRPAPPPAGRSNASTTTRRCAAPPGCAPPPRSRLQPSTAPCTSELARSNSTASPLDQHCARARRSRVARASTRVPHAARRPWAATEASGKNGRMKITRGFTGRAHPERSERLPPGQYDTGNSWPVLTAEVTPKLSTDTWTFRIEGLVEQETTWTWDEIHALPGSTYDGDIHCVTTWSKFDMTFTGVSVDTLLDIAPSAPGRHARARVLAHRLHDEPAARRRHRRQGVGRVGGRRRAALAASTAGRPGCSSRTSTSGRAPSGSPACACSTTTSPGSGSATATTTAATRGSSSATRATDARDRRRARVTVAVRTCARDPRRERRAKTFRLALAQPTNHRAGQHYVVRLTAPDGYTASRSYSVASAPDGTDEFELTVERLEGGEVSSFLHDVVEVGDELEVRGPIGGWFVWDGATPAVLVGGGSGIVPLMAMLRLARAAGSSELVRLVVSVRSPADLSYADELAGPRDHDRLHARGAAVGRRARRAGSRSTTWRRLCCPTRPRTCADRRVSPTLRATCSSPRASAPIASGSSASARPVERASIVR